MEYLALVALASVGLGVGIPLFNGRAREAVWGTKKGPPQRVGATPYRAGTSRAIKPKGAPWTFRFTAGANSFWGVITVMIFSPAGLLLLTAAPQQAPVATVPILLVSLSGFGTGVALCVAARRLLRREALAGVRKIAKWSQLHHISVALTMAFASAEMNEGYLIALALVPCLLGGSLAHALSASAHNAELTAYADELDQPVWSPSY